MKNIQLAGKPSSKNAPLRALQFARLLPSIESQLFFSHGAGLLHKRNHTLQSPGIQIVLTVRKGEISKSKRTLVIRNIHINSRCSSRGWFTCFALNVLQSKIFDALEVQTVYNTKWRSQLLRIGAVSLGEEEGGTLALFPSSVPNILAFLMKERIWRPLNKKKRTDSLLAFLQSAGINSAV